MTEQDVSRIFSAAVINEEFREGILKQQTRMETIKRGYMDSRFNLNPDEEALFENIEDVEKLPDLAEAVVLGERKL